MRANTLTMPICYNSEVPQNGAGMYPSRDVTFNYRVSYARVKRTIPLLREPSPLQKNPVQCMQTRALQYYLLKSLIFSMQHCKAGNKA